MFNYIIFPVHESVEKTVNIYSININFVIFRVYDSVEKTVDGAPLRRVGLSWYSFEDGFQPEEYRNKSIVIIAKALPFVTHVSVLVIFNGQTRYLVSIEFITLPVYNISYNIIYIILYCYINII